MKRRIRFLLIAVAVLAALMALPVTRHLRLKREVALYREQLKARGELVALEQVAGLPASNSVAGVELLNTSEAFGNDPIDFMDPMTLLAPGRARALWACETLPYDLTTNVWPRWEMHFTTHEATIALLVETVRLPLQFETDFLDRRDFSRDQTGLPWRIRATRTAARWLCASSLDSLRRGRPEAALTYFESCLRMLINWQNDPTILAGTAKSAIGTLAFDTTWELLQFPGWNDAQLSRMQAGWEAVDFASELDASLALEHVAHLTEIHQRRKSFHDGMEDQSRPREFFRYIRYAISEPEAGLKEFDERYPTYWTWRWFDSYEEELRVMREWQQMLDSMRQARTESPHSWAALFAATESQVFGDDNRSSYVPGNRSRVRRYIRRIAGAQTIRNLAIAGIGLQRWQIQRGGYPDELTALVPRYVTVLPRDIDGEALRYRNVNGMPVMYSIGHDGRDDEGSSMPLEDRSLRFVMVEPHSIFYGRDWVWPTRATAEEVQAHHDRIIARVAPPGRVRRNRPVQVQSEFLPFIHTLITELELTPVREGTNGAN